MRAMFLALALLIPATALAPSFPRAQTFTPAWDTSIGNTGMDNRVLSFAVHDEGSGPRLFAAGLFTTAGGVTANRIARWDAGAWSAVGTGLGNQALSLQAFDDGTGPALYVGGLFSALDGAAANNIVRWTGCASDTPALSGWGGALLALVLAAGGAIRTARKRRGTASDR